MRFRIKSSSTKKIVSYLASLSMFVNISAPFLVAMPGVAYAAEETTASENSVVADESPFEELLEASAESEEPAVVDESVNSIDTEEQPGEILPEAAATVREGEDGYEELADGAVIAATSAEDWEIDGDVVETKDDVVIGVRYAFPLDEDVSVTFTKLPKNLDFRSHLKIERVKVSDLDLPDDVVPVTEYAYDITTDMEEGEFEYDLTLSRPEDVDAEISYIEKTVTELETEEVSSSDVKKVEENKLDQKEDMVKASGMDHFSIYFVTYPISTVTNSGVTNASYAYTSNDQYAVFDNNGDSAEYRMLNVTKVGSGDTIDGIKVIIEGKQGTGSMSYFQVALWNSSSSSYANQNSPMFPFSPTEGNITLGGTSYLWGKTWNSDDFNSNNFKVRLTRSGSSDLYVDQVRVEVYFTHPVVWPVIWPSVAGCNSDPSDESPSQLDILGDATHPAAYFATDANYLYLRERIEGDPSGTGMFTQHNWVVLAEQTGDNYYDFLFTLNGVDERVQVRANTSQDAVIDWSPLFNDPADTSPIWYGLTSTYARIDAADPGYYFVSWAVPRDMVGFTFGANPTLYFATSANANNYNKDHLNCYEEPTPVCGNSILEAEEQCDDGNVADGDGCSATCQIEPSSITIEKDVVPDDSSLWNFTISGSGGPYTIENLGDGDSGAVFNLGSGSYNITETSNSNYTVDISCDGNPGGAGINGYLLSLSAGYDAVCTVTNTRRTGEVTFQKLVDSGNPDDWSFTVRDVTGALVGTYSHDETATLPIGVYAVTESGDSGFTLDDISGICDESPTLGVATLVVTENGGTCTFNNLVQRGSIQIRKTADTVSDQPFSFTAVGVEGFTLYFDDNPVTIDSISWNSLLPGVYSFAEVVSAGWDLTSISCRTDDPTVPILASGDGVTITLDKNEHVVCTFNNTFIGTCGDGVLDDGEDCDNGVLNGQSSCSQTCEWERECSDEMLANGSFEIPDVTNGAGWDVFDNGMVPGWTAEWYGGYSPYSGHTRPDPKLELHAGINGWGSASDQHVELDSDWTGPDNGFTNEPASITVSQQFPTIVGYEYTVSWDYAARPNHSNNRLGVYVNGSEVFNSGNIAGGPSIDWQTETYTFTATTAVTTLSFREPGTPDSYGMFLDDVGVECLGPAKGSLTICKYNDLDKDSLIDDGEPKLWWEMTVVDQDGEDTGETWYTATPEGDCLILNGMDLGEYEVTETHVDGWTRSFPVDSDSQSVTLSYANPDVTADFLNYEAPVVNIVATKIVCTDESDLPNWGNGPSNDITEITAQRWVNAHPNCRLEPNWSFQWGDDGDTNPGDDTIGEVAGWNTFGPTDADGKATVSINDFGNTSQIKVREVLQNGYTPFTYTINGNSNSDNVSAEIYCDTDVLNYDNDDRISSPQYGQTYYCVAFNAQTDVKINIDKQGPVFAEKDEPITYDYVVTNPGNVPLVDVLVTDDKCSPVVYQGGDTNGNTKLEPEETWSYSCTTTPTWVFNTQLVNMAKATGFYMDTKVEAEDQYKLYSLILRKDVKMQGGGPYRDPNTLFDVEVRLSDVVVDSVAISESNPAKMWVAEGSYQFCEVNMPVGYVPHYTGGCLTFTTGTYPDWTHINYIQPLTIVVHKIVCQNESDLPNWGNGPSNNITEITAQRWVNAHPGCHFEEGWQFQWGDDADFNPGDDTIGEVAGWNTFGPTDADGKATVAINDFGITQQLKVREVLKDGYLPFTYTISGNQNTNPVSAELYCGTDVLNYDNDDRISNPQYGQTYNCVAWNVELSDIHGYKWDDLNGNGVRDCVDEGVLSEFTLQALFDEGPRCELEPLLSGWTINLYRWNGEGYGFYDSMVTDDNVHLGWYWFEDLLPGEYKICEEAQSGWDQTHPGVAQEPECYTVQLPNDCGEYGNDTLITRIATPNAVETFCEFHFGNQPVVPQLLISKENDTNGANKKSGDEVLFTLKIWAMGSSVANVEVTDLMSNGFIYVAGSARVNGAVPPTEPNYSSPGTWDLGYLGTINPGDPKTVLTYRATIDNGVDPGSYKDIAWAVGMDRREGGVYAIADGLGDLDTGDDESRFVGTLVAVVVDPEPTKDEVAVKELEEEEGEVLGISTLPATGIQTLWVRLAFGMGFTGILLLLLGGVKTTMTKKKIKGFKVLMLCLGIVGFGLLVNRYVYAASSLEVRISEPKSPATSEFDITFVVMDIEDRNLNAQCYVKKPGSATFSSFGSPISIPSGNGGDSKECGVGSSILTSNGTYEFKVGVVTTSGNPGSSEDSVSVIYDGTGPGKPKYIEKDKKTSCKNEITFKTSGDGDTDYAEVYKDDDMEIEINEGSKIKTITIGPDEKYTFVDEFYGSDCGKTFYYAVRAFDAAGNASSPRAEEVVTTVKITTESKEGEKTTEALYVGDAGLLEGEGVSAGGAEVVLDDTGESPEGEEGSVLGEETVVQDEGKGEGSIFSKWWLWVILAGIAGFIGNEIRKKRAN